MTTNATVLNWVEEIRSLVKPGKEVWIDGTEEQANELRQLAVDLGILKPLNEKKLPGCSIHRTSVGDAARNERRTFICCETREKAGPTNNWREPQEMYMELRMLFSGIMRNRTMYIIPFCLGNPGSPLCKAGVKITDSLYVALNTLILARCGKPAANYLDNAGENWFKGLHSVGAPNSQGDDNRYICHFPQDDTVWSINTGYGTSALLSKKSFALRLASQKAKDEGWFAEQMAIIEVERPKSEAIYIAAAFPSGAGKTSLAMMDVCETYAKKGYKVRCVSEDVAWLKRGADGRLWAINPEIGVFGSLPGVSDALNPNVIATAQKNSIFSNVAHNLDDDTVWWEGLNDEEITNAIDWRGRPWDNIRNVSCESDADAEFAAEIDDEDESVVMEQDAEELEDVDAIAHDEDDEDAELVGQALSVNGVLRRGAHSGSRFTAAIDGCPNLSPKWNSPEGVPISAIIFGGRRTKTVPLVYQSFDWVHGIFVGSMLGTEAINPLKPNSPIIRRDPSAMGQFCGYNMGEYWRQWLKLGKKLGRNAPKIFNVNWFKNGPDGKPLWPGFGENIRVLDWIIKRAENRPDKPGIIETPVGYIPKPEDIDIIGLEDRKITIETIQALLSVEKVLWKEDVNGVKQLYGKFGDKLPEELKEQLVDLEKRLLNA